MARLSFNSFTLLYPFPFSSAATAAIPTVSRLRVKPIDVPSKCVSGVRISLKRTAALVVRAASVDADGAASADDGGSPPLGDREVVPVDRLPLESKLHEREAQRLRMKMAKKIRLRRKRLDRKRRLRKKGRWPTSKINRLKNV